MLTSLIALVLVQVGSSPPQATRPFLMGFTEWPADITVEGVKMAKDFAAKHGDVLSVMFIGGVPWPEALAGKPYSNHVEQHLSIRPSKGQKLFLSLSPLNMDRSGLAPYWGASDNMPLPEEWSGKAFDHPDVLKAYSRFVMDAAGRMKPDYLAIAIEANALISHAPEKWPALVQLYTATRRAVKDRHPNLPVFFTTEVVHLKEMADRSKNKGQLEKVRQLMAHSDLFAMSLYPHMSYEVPRPFPKDFLDFAKQFNKPIAMAETGMTSQNVELKSYKLTLFGSPKEQADYLSILLETALRDRYTFVVHYATTDFEKLCRRLQPPLDDLGRIWSMTGLQDENGKPKPALAVWNEHFRLRYKPSSAN